VLLKYCVLSHMRPFNMKHVKGLFWVKE
jgi:hypothetical protein